MGPPQRKTGRALQDFVVGIAAAVLAFAAVPGVLAWFVGVPLPPRWSQHAVLSLHGLFDLLALAAWVAWAACAWPLLRSVVTRVRARDAGAGTSTLAIGDRLALRIAAAVLVVAPLAAIASTAGAGATTVRAGATTVGASASPPFASASRASAQDAATTVSDGESLWTIADAAYGDGGAWPAIARANLGRLMPDARRFVDPGHLQAGWTLTVPQAERSVDRQADGREPERHDSADADRRGAATRSNVRQPDGPAAPDGLLLPELAILGTGALVAALLARRARTARRLRAFVRAEGAPSWSPSAAGADLARTVAAFADVPLPQWIELAMRAISSSRPTTGGPALPPLRLVRAGSDGVEVRFASSPPQPAAPWAPSGPGAWILPASADVNALRTHTTHHRAWTPVLLPLGEDERGSWMLPLTAGACLCVVGPAAPALAETMLTGATSWTWREDLLVTADPAAASAAALPGERRSDGSVSTRVLFTADPRTLAPGVRRHCAVLTLAQVADADVSVMVDERAATVHPLGLTVRPHLLRPSWAGVVNEVCTFEPEERSPTSGTHAANGHGPASGNGSGRGPAGGAPVDPSAGPPGAAPPPAPALRAGRDDRATIRVRDTGLHPTPAPANRPDQPAPAAGEAGAVDVRLLAALPSVQGLADALPPKRARRAVELLAYLALAAPQPVTGDRLRTRVLGTADADAAAKTLFNTVGAARRALGSGVDGEPLLPPATRSGQYCLSAAVTVDARRCVTLLTAGLEASDPVHQAASLQAGLALIAGEPLSGVLTGYGWWQAEGHERRLADAVVDGACALVRAATHAGRIDLGRWALEKARLVEPYSEALTRAAMALAAAAGDARRLRLEWEDCRRQVDELDPGGTPSQATELFYARLRQHLRDGAMASVEDVAGEPTAVLGV